MKRLAVLISTPWARPLGAGRYQREHVGPKSDVSGAVQKDWREYPPEGYGTAVTFEGLADGTWRAVVTRAASCD